MQPNPLEAAWERIRAELERRKNQIYEDISSYPPQITNCDQQFDHLLEEQERISRELNRMQEVSKASFAHRDPAKLIDEFISSSTYFDDQAEQKIRSSLRKASFEPGM